MRDLDIAVKCSQIPIEANMWTRVGSLLTPRFGHRSIVIEDSIMHIGGYRTKLVFEKLNNFTKFCFRYFERWTADGTKFIKEELPTNLTWYDHYPESFLVSSDFCV